MVQSTYGWFLASRIAAYFTLGDSMRWVGGAWWELELASGWHDRNDPECLTLTASDEGAFQLSSATKSAGEITVDELKEFYGSELSEGQQVQEVTFGSFRGVATELLDGNALWHKFWLAHGNLMVYATYNGTKSAWAREKGAVHAMLATLRIRPTANRQAS